MLERDFQAKLIKEIKCIFPGSIVLKTDPNYIQGFPDLLILFTNGQWAALECKRSSSASVRPNQKHYVEKLNSMAFASFISPENKEDILNDLQLAFKFGRLSCIPRSQ